MTRLLAATFAALVLAACPKRTSTNVSGSDDEMMDQYSAQLEELRTSVQAREPKCSEWKSMADKACDISRNVCDIAKRNAGRDDMQKRCVDSQEDCIRFKESAGSCQG